MRTRSSDASSHLRACLAAVLLSCGILFAPSTAYAEEFDTTAVVAQDDSTAVPVEPQEVFDTTSLPETTAEDAVALPSDDTVTDPVISIDEQVPEAAPSEGVMTDPDSGAEPASSSDDAPVSEAQETTEASVSPSSDGADEAAAATTSPEEDPATQEDTLIDEAASKSDELNGKTFVIESGLSDPQVVDAKGGRADNGTNVQTYTYNGSTAQKWKLVSAGNSYYYIASMLNLNRVLDVAGGKAKSGSNVQVWNKNGSDAQLWKFEVKDAARSLYTIISKLSEKAGFDLVLDIAGAKTSNGTNLQLYKASANNKAQRFYLIDTKPNVTAGYTLPDGDGVYEIYAVSAASDTGYTATSYTADVAGGSKDNGANLRIYKSNGSAAQRLLFTSDDKGYYTIAVLGSAKVFDVAGGKIIPGTNVQQYQFNGSDAQKWSLRRNSNGTFSFVNKGTGLVLDLGSTTIANGTNLQGYRPRSTGIRQQFALTKDKVGLLSDGYFAITSVADSSKVLDIRGGYASTKGTGYVQLYTSNASNAQIFQVIDAGKGTYRIRTAASGGWLTGGEKGTQVTQTGSSATESSADRWRVLWDKKGYWALQNVATKLVLDLRGGKYTNSTVVQSYTSNASTAQRFIFTPVDLVKEGVYFVNSYYSSAIGIQQCLDVQGGSIEPGANVRIHNSNSSDGQKFTFKKSGSAYRITNYNSGYALTVSDTATAKANVTQKRLTDTKNQLWLPSIADDGYLMFTNVASGMIFEAQGSESDSNVAQHQASKAVNGGRWKLVATSDSISYEGKGSHADVRVLLIGNSFTYRSGSEPNNLPSELEKILDATCTTDVRSRANPGKTLSYTTNPNASYAAARVATANEKQIQESYATTTLERWLHDGCDWDYIVIQELSTRPIDEYNLYLASLTGTIYTDSNTGRSYSLLDLIKQRGATPILYATWAFPGNTTNGGSVSRGISNATMHAQLQTAFKKASKATGTVMSNVGQAFADHSFKKSLYASDVKHTSSTGTKLAAQTLAETIKGLMGS